MTEVVEILTYRLEHPDGTPLAIWRVPADVHVFHGPRSIGDNFWISDDCCYPPWILRCQQGTGDWVTLDQRPVSIPQTDDTDQDAGPPSSGV